MIRLILQSIRHYWRTHLGVVLGCALAAMVLTGSLMVGDSVKGTLRAQAEARVGKIGEALLCGERFVPWPADKARRPAVVARMFFPGDDSAGVLLMHGAAARADGKARANRVQIVGVDEAFWRLSPGGSVGSDRTDGSIAVNQRLAAQLQLAPGDELSFYVEKPGAISRDAPLSGDENALITVKARVARIVGDEDFGRFALTASQVPPNTVFVPLAELQQRVKLGEKVNAILQQRPTPNAQHPTSNFDASTDGLRSTISDFDLAAKSQTEGGVLGLTATQVFLDPAIIAAARENERTPSTSHQSPVTSPPPGLDSLTYFVTSIEKGTPPASDSATPTKVGDYFRATPYSMVTALDAPASGFVQAELADDEIQITRWLADDLAAKPGDALTLRYFVMGERRELVEKARTFTVLAPIIEMNEPQLDSSWMPDFPDVPDKKSFRNWKPGFPFDSKRIRKQDEDYWEQHRGTPKAFVNLKVGQEMWGNRWGNLTSIRYPAGTKREQVERIAAFIDPKALGFRVVNLREQALAATDAPVDFGQLFTAFSFFLIAAAAVLTGLLFTFTIEQRAAEAGLLLATGWREKQVRRLFLKEGALLALAGAALGTTGALLYTRGVLWALGGVWSGATGGATFIFVAKAGTVFAGIAAAVFIALLAMWLASRKLFRQEAAQLMKG